MSLSREEIKEVDVVDKDLYEKGLAVRRDVLGKEYVDKAIASADDNIAGAVSGLGQGYHAKPAASSIWPC
jgi:hypothetical protein